MNNYYGYNGADGNHPPYNGYPPYGGFPGDPMQNEKNEQKKRLARISIIVGCAVVGFSGLSTLIAFILRKIPGFLNTYSANPEFQVAFSVLFSLTIIGIPFLIAYLLLKKSGDIKTLPLGTPHNGAAFGLLVFIGLMVCIGGSYATGVFRTFIESFFGVTFYMPEETFKLKSMPLILLYILQTAVVPAFIEEFSIRGVVMQSLRKYGDKFAIVMSALVFALMHGNMVQIPFAFIAGIAIGYIVIITGSLWTGVLIHFLNNLASISMQIAYDNCTQMQANIITLSIVFIIFAVGIVCSILYKKRYAHGFPLSAESSVLLKNGEKTSAFLVTIPMIAAFAVLLYQTASYIDF